MFPARLPYLTWIGIVLLVVRIAAADIVYSACTLDVSAGDADTLSVELDCTNGSGDKKLYSEQLTLPLSTPVLIPGTPISILANADAVFQMSGNSDGGDVFEITECDFRSLPSNLGMTESLIRVTDARIAFRNCRFPLDDFEQTSGALHLDYVEDPTFVLTEDPPTTGPIVSIYTSHFTGGAEDHGAIYISSFPYVYIFDTTFNHGTSQSSEFIHRGGYGIVLVSQSTFDGPGEMTQQSKGFYGAGNGKIIVEDSTFSGINGVIDWLDQGSERTDLVFRYVVSRTTNFS